MTDNETPKNWNQINTNEMLTIHILIYDIYITITKILILAEFLSNSYKMKLNNCIKLLEIKWGFLQLKNIDKKGKYIYNSMYPPMEMVLLVFLHVCGSWYPGAAKDIWFLSTSSNCDFHLVFKCVFFLGTRFKPGCQDLPFGSYYIMVNESQLHCESTLILG